jgi:hypothetical protein
MNGESLWRRVAELLLLPWWATVRGVSDHLAKRLQTKSLAVAVGRGQAG